VMEWCKGKILATRDDVNTVRIALGAGLPDDTKVIVMVPFSNIRNELNPEWVWQGCVTSGNLVAVEMVNQCNLPIPPSPSPEAAPSLSLTNTLQLSVYVSERICKLYQFKNQDYVWLQPIKSFSVQEVWLSPSSSSDFSCMEQFLDQLSNRVASRRLLVKMGGVFRFELQDKVLFFDVVQVSPMCQGHLTSDTCVFVLPSSDNTSPRRHSDSDSDSDDRSRKTYHVQPGIIEDRQDDGSDDDTESEDDLTNHLYTSHTKLPQASQIRKSSVVTLGDSAHLLSCVPINNFPADKNFIILPSQTLKKLNCYGLENLLISPLEMVQPDGFHGVSFVAVVEETKDCLHYSNCVYPVAYLHPELFYNLFPYPMDQAVSDCVIRAKVYCCNFAIVIFLLW